MTRIETARERPGCFSPLSIVDNLCPGLFSQLELSTEHRVRSTVYGLCIFHENQGHLHRSCFLHCPGQLVRPCSYSILRHLITSKVGTPLPFHHLSLTAIYEYSHVLYSIPSHSMRSPCDRLHRNPARDGPSVGSGVDKPMDTSMAQ